MDILIVQCLYLRPNINLLENNLFIRISIEENVLLTFWFSINFKKEFSKRHVLFLLPLTHALLLARLRFLCDRLAQILHPERTYQLWLCFGKLWVQLKVAKSWMISYTWKQNKTCIAKKCSKIYWIFLHKAEEDCVKLDQCQVNTMWLELTYHLETSNTVKWWDKETCIRLQEGT